MVVVSEVSEVYVVDSQYSKESTDMVTVTLQGSSASSNGNQNGALLGKAAGIADLTLGGVRQVSVSVKAKYADKFAEGTVFPELHINREWTDVNPYPKAVDEDGNPLAKTRPITHPEFGEIDVFSRTFLGDTAMPDTWLLTDDYEEVGDQLMAAPIVQPEPAANVAKKAVRRNARG